MMNKKGVISVVFLVISLLVVSSGLIITVQNLKKSDNENNIAETESIFLDNEFSNQNSLSDLSFLNDEEDFESLSLSSSGGGGGSSSRSSSSFLNNVENIENDTVIVIDITSEETLNYGTTSLSYNAFSLSGPVSFNPCTGSWSISMNNVKDWFNDMGYNTEAVEWPIESKIKSHIQSNETFLFYEAAHGDSTSFGSGCVNENNSEKTYASEIETWIDGYRKMPFTFLNSCNTMCETGEGSLSYAFRKGSDKNTVTVGYCNLSATCNTFAWQNYLFYYMDQGWTVKASFDKANEKKPRCTNYTRFAGDEDFKIVWYDWSEYYCKDDNVYLNKTKHNLVSSAVVEERLVQNCRDDYCENWQDNYCKEGDVYHNRTCYDKGCIEGACYNEEYEEEEIVQSCEFGCENAECKNPDLVIEDLIVQSIRDKTITLAFTIKNIGNAIADQVYWMVDTNSLDENPERIKPISLEPDNWTRAYMMWNYSQSGNYTPKVIVDFDNLINESNEDNNEESILVGV